MSSAISEMSEADKRLQEESPNLIAFRQAMGASRFSRLMAVYLLVDELDDPTCYDEDGTIQKYAKAAGTSPEVMRVDLRWARCIPEKDLRKAFADEKIGDLEWSERISLEHLRTICKATLPNGCILPAEDMIRRLVNAYHADETSGEFKDHLRADGLIKAREPKRYSAEQDAKDEEAILKAREAIGYLVECLRGERGEKVQKAAMASWKRRTRVLPSIEAPATLNELVTMAMTRMTENDKDIALKVSGNQLQPKMGTSWLLRQAAKRYDELYPGAEFTLEPNTPKETAAERKEERRGTTWPNGQRHQT